MKRLSLLTFVVLFGFILLQPVLAENFNTDTGKDKVETNLLLGIKSDNAGLRMSSAYYLGELKSEKAVFHLIKMLRSETEEAARIIAALSLIKIEDPQGLFMVKRTAKFNEFDRVRKLSDQFYTSYIIKKYISQHPEKANMFAGL